MKLDEIKKKLDMRTDREVALMFNRGVAAVSNWRRLGKVPPAIILRAQEVSNFMEKIKENTIVKVGITTPEAQIVSSLMKDWPEEKRRALLKYALDLDGLEGRG